MADRKPTVGEDVLYRCTNGEDRSARVTKVWTETCVNLTVFLAGSVDSQLGHEFMFTTPGWLFGHQTSVQHQPNGAPVGRTWRWPA